MKYMENMVKSLHLTYAQIHALLAMNSKKVNMKAVKNMVGRGLAIINHLRTLKEESPELFNKKWKKIQKDSLADIGVIRMDEDLDPGEKIEKIRVGEIHSFADYDAEFTMWGLTFQVYHGPTLNLSEFADADDEDYDDDDDMAGLMKDLGFEDDQIDEFMEDFGKDTATVFTGNEEVFYTKVKIASFEKAREKYPQLDYADHLVNVYNQAINLNMMKKTTINFLKNMVLKEMPPHVEFEIETLKPSPNSRKRDDLLHLDRTISFVTWFDENAPYMYIYFATWISPDENEMDDWYLSNYIAGEYDGKGKL